MSPARHSIFCGSCLHFSSDIYFAISTTWYVAYIFNFSVSSNYLCCCSHIPKWPRIYFPDIFFKIFISYVSNILVLFVSGLVSWSTSWLVSQWTSGFCFNSEVFVWLDCIIEASYFLFILVSLIVICFFISSTLLYPVSLIPIYSWFMILLPVSNLYPISFLDTTSVFFIWIDILTLYYCAVILK